MYHDAYTIQLVEDRHLATFNFVGGMGAVPAKSDTGCEWYFLLWEIKRIYKGMLNSVLFFLC